MHSPLTTSGYMAGNSPACNTTGRDLAVVAKNSSPTTQAFKAVDLVRGHTSVSWFLPGQAIGLTGSSRGYLNTALGLTPDERRQVEIGTASLAFFHKRPPFRTDQWLERLITDVGADRVRAVLDRIAQTHRALVVYEPHLPLVSPVLD